MIFPFEASDYVWEILTISYYSGIMITSPHAPQT